jgi:RNA polymerase I-specific transcription initiation factor RRN3
LVLTRFFRTNIYWQVEIQIELDDLEELVAERGQVTGEVFELDPFEGVVGQDDAADSDDDGGSDDGDDNFSDLSSEAASVDEDADPKEPPGMDVPHIQEMVAKLDAVLTLLFEHFRRIDAPAAVARSDMPSTPTTPAPAREPSPGALARARIARHAQFQVLLGIFERTILRTFKSRYTQFLVFWAASRDAECCDELQGMLVQRALLDGARPAVERAAAAAYLASLVSRAAFVAREAARDVVALLCRYLAAHLDLADGYLRGGLPLPASQHGVFFAAAQAVFLIFCFRWRDLLERGEDEDEAGADAPPPPGAKWMPELLVLQRAVTSPLNPLKVRRPPR